LRCEHPVFETGVATSGHLILPSQSKCRRESPTGDYDRALEDERSTNMVELLIKDQYPIVK
jgi:hypothetical protein